MTDLKPPEVFQANDFRGVFATPSSIADHVNRLLAQKLKPWYFDSKHLGESDFVITGNERDGDDTHVMWSLEPQKLGPVKVELELHSDLQSNNKVDIPKELKGKKFKVIFEEAE